MATEIVTVEPEVNYVADRHFSLKVLKSFLVGNRWREKGETVSLPEQAAKEAIRCGAAQAHGLGASAASYFAMPTAKPKPEPVERTGGRYIRVLKGSFFDATQSRSFVPEDGMVRVFCRITPELVDDPSVPFASRRGTVIELVDCTPEDHKRVIEEGKKARALKPTERAPNRFGCSVEGPPARDEC
jgi:hypothetical protein